MSALSESVSRVMEKLASPEHEARLAAAEQQERLDAQADIKAFEVKQAANILWAERGTRYKACTLENFEAATEAQKLVLDAIQVYRASLTENVKRGRNIVLTGPPGTGKDHLLAGLMHTAIASGHVLKWTNGVRLWVQFRGAIESDADEGILLREYSRQPDVLVLSDPLPAVGGLTPYQAATLYAIIDERYNNRRAMWVSLNAKSRQEANERIGGAIIDRLLQDALSLLCDWESFRKPQR